MNTVIEFIKDWFLGLLSFICELFFRIGWSVGWWLLLIFVGVLFMAIREKIYNMIISAANKRYQKKLEAARKEADHDKNDPPNI